MSEVAARKTVEEILAGVPSPCRLIAKPLEDSGSKPLIPFQAYNGAVCFFLLFRLFSLSLFFYSYFNLFTSTPLPLNPLPYSLFPIPSRLFLSKQKTKSQSKLVAGMNLSLKNSKVITSPQTLLVVSCFLLALETILNQNNIHIYSNLSNKTLNFLMPLRLLRSFKMLSMKSAIFPDVFISPYSLLIFVSFNIHFLYIIPILTL